MKMKKLAAVALTAAMVLGLAACGSSSSGKDSYGYMVAMITDTGGVNDQSFNQSAWEGLQKLHADTGAEIPPRMLALENLPVLHSEVIPADKMELAVVKNLV